MEIPQEAAAYFSAINEGDLRGALCAFHPQARILDVDRLVAGLPEIREWLINEVIGGEYNVLDKTALDNATLFVVEFTTPESEEMFRANYVLTFRDGKIESANLQYAPGV